MLVERSEFLSRCGLDDIVPGTFLKREAGTGHAAWISWSSEGDVALRIYCGAPEEENDPLIEIFGTFDGASFDVDARDERPEAADRQDVMSAMAAFRRHLPSTATGERP